MSLCSNSPLQTEGLLTHQFAMVIPNVCSDLLQPAREGVLSAALHLNASLTNGGSEQRQ